MPEMWFYTTQGKQMDPVSMKELKRLVGEGVLKPTDMVWKDGMARWIRASSMKELFPDPISALDQYFTHTKEANKPDGNANMVTAPVGVPAQPVAVSEPAAIKKAGVPTPAEDEPQIERKRRRPSEDD